MKLADIKISTFAPRILHAEIWNLSVYQHTTCRLVDGITETVCLCRRSMWESFKNWNKLSSSSLLPSACNCGPPWQTHLWLLDGSLMDLTSNLLYQCSYIVNIAIQGFEITSSIQPQPCSLLGSSLLLNYGWVITIAFSCSFGTSMCVFISN